MEKSNALMPFIAKSRIKYYLKMYPYLNANILKITKDIKYYNFILWNYIKRLPKEEVQKKLGTTSLKEIDEEVIEYLYNTMLEEAIHYGKKS